MARQAWVNLRFTLEHRRVAVCEGLRRAGFEPCEGLTRTPADGDMLLSWNRIHEGDEAAKVFEARGLPVLVMENSTWGNTFCGRDWWTLCRNFHNVANRFPVGGPERWDSLAVELEPWRTEGEHVVLASRGIGPIKYRMPYWWPQRQAGRLRPHPGRGVAKPLREDLAQCASVLTWGSGSAVLALSWGIKVQSDQPEWIAEQDNTTEGRLEMFRRLAWAQWTHDEIATGEPFKRLLSWQGGDGNG